MACNAVSLLFCLTMIFEKSDQNPTTFVSKRNHICIAPICWNTMKLFSFLAGYKKRGWLLGREEDFWSDNMSFPKILTSKWSHHCNSAFSQGRQNWKLIRSLENPLSVLIRPPPNSPGDWRGWLTQVIYTGDWHGWLTGDRLVIDVSQDGGVGDPISSSLLYATEPSDQNTQSTTFVSALNQCS
jgi:hypothetical protein